MSLDPSKQHAESNNQRRNDHSNFNIFKKKPPTSSFTTKRINSSTFMVYEDDLYKEHPYIYVKLHPKAPIIILTDTGCDEPSSRSKKANITHLREYLENMPLECNDDRPLNPESERQYYIICTHCHFDHIGGISQFLEGGTTEVIASAAGRDFIESDLESHSLFKYIDKPTPYYFVTHWAQAFEKLQHPIEHPDWDVVPKAKESASKRPIDLGMTMIHTPGHTPDELAWYDHEEMHLYVGDSLYEEGTDVMPIIFPGDGNLIEWAFSMRKLQYMVRGENARAASKSSNEDEDGWCQVSRRVKLAAGHQTHSADAEEFLDKVARFWWDTLAGRVPVVKKECWLGEVTYTWREKDGRSKLSFMAPVRLMDEARKFFEGTSVYGDEDRSSDFPG